MIDHRQAAIDAAAVAVEPWVMRPTLVARKVIAVGEPYLRRAFRDELVQAIAGVKLEMPRRGLDYDSGVSDALDRLRAALEEIQGRRA